MSRPLKRNLSVVIAVIMTVSLVLGWVSTVSVAYATEGVENTEVGGSQLAEQSQGVGYVGTIAGAGPKRAFATKDICTIKAAIVNTSDPSSGSIVPLVVGVGIALIIAGIVLAWLRRR